MTHRTLSNYHKYLAGIPINGNALRALKEKKLVNDKGEIVHLATVTTRLSTNSEAS